MASLMEELIATLRKEQEAYQELLPVAEQKTQAIIANDLTKVQQIVVTGGSLIHTKRTAEIAANALYSPAQPTSLRPKKASVWVDRTYIMAAMGLLSVHYPQAALRIMKKELEFHGNSEQETL